MYAVWHSNCRNTRSYLMFSIADDVSVLLSEIMTEARNLTNAER